MALTQIKSGAIADDAIDSSTYIDGSIDNAHLADDAVDGDKLANNIDVAGTLDVTGDLTINTDALFVDASAKQVGIGTMSPSDVLTVAGADAFIKVDRSNGNPGIDFRYNGSTSNRALIDVTSGGDLRLAAGGNTERMRIDSSGNVTIGTGSIVTPHPSGDDFVIDKGGTDTGLSIYSTTTARILFGDAATSEAGAIIYGHSNDSMQFRTAAAERMRINAGGDVNITGICTATSFKGDGSGLSGVGGDTDITSCLFI